MKTATITARIEPEIKHDAESVFSDIGLSASDAITIFYKRVARERAIPFSLEARQKLPSFDKMSDEEIRAELKKALQEMQDGQAYSLEESRALLKSREYGTAV